MNRTHHAKPWSPARPETRLTGEADAAKVVSGIREFGYVIVEGLAPELTAQAAREVDPLLKTTPFGTGDFTGLKTQRISRLIARSPACRQMATHPLVLEAVSRLFEGSCYHPQLSLSMGVRIQPGETKQSLHRDDNVYALAHPRPPVVLNSMWAVTDFTVHNGATRLVPRSHGWDDQRSPREDEAVAAEMPAGSVLLWDGGLYHGGGANTSHEARLGLVLAYSLGWLRQYENMYLSVPPELARTLPVELQELIGYGNHGFLGTYDNESPLNLLSGSVTGTPRDLYTDELEAKAIHRF